MKNWLIGSAALAVFVSICGISYIMRKPAEYTAELLGKSVLMRAMRSVEQSSDGNAPMEIQCSRKAEPVGSEPVVMVCTGTGSKGHFTATFMAATKLPQFSLAGQGSAIGLIMTKIDGVPSTANDSLVHAFEEVLAAPPQISN